MDLSRVPLEMPSVQQCQWIETSVRMVYYALGEIPWKEKFGYDYADCLLLYVQRLAPYLVSLTHLNLTSLMCETMGNSTGSQYSGKNLNRMGTNFRHV